MGSLIQALLTWIINLVTSIWNLIFGDVQFSVLWNWLPSDIQSACVSLIMVLFILVLIRFIRSILPF